MENQIENNNNTAQQDFVDKFTPAVHKIGRFTMTIAFILSFLPIGYFLLRGYGMPFHVYLSVFIAISSIGIGMWLTEPIAYWPVLGSAGTYIGYLAGNVGGMRFPVALSVQSAMDADINTPRGQIATIVGIVGSVFSNLIILLITVLAGAWLLGVLPENILSAFGFALPTILGAMLILRLNGKKGIVQETLSLSPYIITAAICKAIISKFPALMGYGMPMTVGITILVAYIIFRSKMKNGSTNNSASNQD